MRFNLRQNLYLKVFSVLLAIVCWYVIRSEQDAVKDFVVPLEYVNLPTALDFGGKVVDRVNVRLRAPEPLLRSITADNIAARIDLAHAVLGEQYVSLTAGMIRVPGGAEVAHIDPALVLVRIDKRVRRDVPVVAEFAGTPPEGYRKISHEIVPSQVAIEGPASDVFRVTRAMAGTIHLNGETSDYEIEVTPVPDAPEGSRVRIVSPLGPVRVRVLIRPDERAATDDAGRTPRRRPR